MGFFTDTTVCIGCKACEVACKQWNDLPADGGDVPQGRLLRQHGRARRDDLAPRALRRARRRAAAPTRRRPDRVGGGASSSRRRRRGRRVRLLGLHVRRLQALHERRLPGRVPDGRADPDRVRDGRRCSPTSATAAATASRRARSGSSTATTTTAAPPSARSATTASRTGSSPRARRRARPTRSSSAPYDELVEVAAAAGRRRCTSAASRAPTCTARATSRRAARRRARRVLPAHRAARALRAAGAGRLADPGERRARDAGRGRRRAARRRGGRRGRVLSCGAQAPMSDERDIDPGRRPHGAAPAFGGRRGEHGRARTAASWARRALVYLYGDDTATATRGDRRRRAPRRRAGARERRAAGRRPGPMMKAPVWTWEVPLYFWFGGIASGSSFVALACDLAGDHALGADRAARRARRARPVAAAADPGPRAPGALPQHAADLQAALADVDGRVGADGVRRPRRGGAVGADLLGRGASRAARSAAPTRSSAATSAPTPACCWPRPRCPCGRARGCSSARSSSATATATGAAARRLVLVATGLPAGHPTRARARRASRRARWPPSCVLSTINERRLGALADGARARAAPGRLFKAGEVVVRGRAGAAVRPPPRRAARSTTSRACSTWPRGLVFRYAWVGAGRHSARDDDVVAQMARERRAGARRPARAAGWPRCLRRARRALLGRAAGLDQVSARERTRALRSLVVGPPKQMSAAPDASCSEANS